MLRFEESEHRYFWQNQEVPSVSAIMSGLRDFAGISQEVLDAASERGTDVHAACALDDRGILDESTVTAEIRPYLDAWRLFRLREQPQWQRIEQPLYHPTYRYAGTPDRVGILRDVRCVGEIKSTVDLHPCFGVQLAGYSKLVDGEGRCVVHLKRNGTYALQFYSDRSDDLAFLALHTLYNWRKRNGL